LLTTHDVDRAERFFGRYGGAAVIVGRLLPGIRSFIALPAGIARMPLVRFHLYTFVVSWPWCFALAYIGMMLGRSWNSDPRLSPLFHKFDAALAAVLL
ncbi:DedA family protein, partial [Streptococcus suis]